jgi:hypothetical protein
MNLLPPSHTVSETFRFRPRLRRLAASLTLAFSGAAAFASPVTHFVTTCNDPDISPLCDGHDDGTLRKAFTCAGNARLPLGWSVRDRTS